MSRHVRLGILFERALSVPRERRARFVAEVCADDAALREDLISLLEAHDPASDYFDKLYADFVAPALSAIALPSDDAGSAMADTLQAKLAGTYRLERELAGGGMSRVFVAEDLRLKRRVVIKVLPPEMAPAADTERFDREIELAARLQHPHIVPLLTTDSVDGILYYTMPFVAGESLSDRLARDGPLPLEDALRIWREVLDALAHAHASGVIHRDVKPGNILLSGRHALVADFGISRAIETAAGDARTRRGWVIGTPAYMAPEDAAGEPEADHRADIYAAGLLMYEMLAGSPPFVEGSARDYLRAHCEREPPPLLKPEVPSSLLELVMRCLAKDPGDRPQSAEAVLAELDMVATVAPRSATTGDGAHRPRRFALYALMALVLLIVTLTAIRLRDDESHITAPTVEPPAIAVLPWTDLGTDSADAALADGMTQELIAALGKGANLRVIGSTSVSALLGRRIGARQLADSLNVSHLLEGRFQKAGSRLRVEVSLVDAQHGSTRWSAAFDREFVDVFDIQEEIALAVARELAVGPAGGRPVRPSTRRQTPDIAAYEWYLRGMDVALLRTDSGRHQGVEYFQRAISLDATYVDAYAGLVRMYLQLANAAPAAAKRRWLESARQAALTAVALDDADPDARAALGWVHLLSRDYAAAEAEFKRAIALDASVPRGHEGLARVYMMTGRPAEQLAEARLGLDADPFSHSAIRELALALAANGRCEDSLDQLRSLRALTPPAGVAGVVSGLCHASRQRWPEAIEDFRWAAEYSATAGRAFLGYALARAGRKDEAARILSDLMAGRTYSHGSFGIAVVYAGMRDYEQAFAWLEKAADEGTVHFYIVHPVFGDLHRDPRFDGIKERTGM